MRTLLRIAIAVLAAAGGLAVLALLLQRRLLYFPERQEPASASRHAARLGLAPVRDPAGAIAGWRAAHPSGRPLATAVVLHGNAGHALHREYLAEVLRAPGVPALDVILLEYPGYGARPGSPTQASLVRAAVDAVDAAPAGPVLLVGESLGTAVAALAAAERRERVTGLLLVTPLASVAAVGRRHYPVLPALLVRDRFESAPALERYGGPAFFLVAGRDEVVFADLGLSLHGAYPGPKRLFVQERATHNAVRYDPADPMWRDAVAFLLGN